MPKFTVPKPKKVKGGVEVAFEPSRPNVFLPANSEILEELEIGDSITVTITGKVIGLEARERTDGEDFKEFSLELKSVETDSKNEFEKMADDDD